MADYTISGLKTKKYVKPVEDGLLIPVSVLEGGKYVSGAIDTGDMPEWIVRKLKALSVFEEKGKGVSISNVKAGVGITVTEHEDGGVVITNSMTHNLYKVVTELPETGEEDKIYLVALDPAVEKNAFTEYAWVNNNWEKIGTHTTEVSLVGYATEKYVQDEIAKIPAVDLSDIRQDIISLQGESATHLTAADITNKVDKVTGKGLSTNDFTDELKTKLEGIAAGAQVNTVLSVNGETGAVTGLAKSDEIPTKVSQLTNDTGYIKATDIVNKVDKEEGKGLSTNDFTTLEKNKLAGIEAGAQVNTVTSVNEMTGDIVLTIPTQASIDAKVDKVTGKGLSTNDFTDVLKTKLEGIADNADVSAVKSVNGKTGDVVLTIPTNLSELTNDANFITSHQSLEEYDKRAVAETKYLKVADYFDENNQLILVKKTELQAVINRVTALETKLAKYDTRFGYSETGDWTKSFLVIEETV